MIMASNNTSGGSMSVSHSRPYTSSMSGGAIGRSYMSCACHYTTLNAPIFKARSTSWPDYTAYSMSLFGPWSGPRIDPLRLL